MKYLQGLLLLALPVCAATGCGGGTDAELAPVSGKITLKGKPLSGAEVHFVQGKFEGFGTTDENGEYRLVRGAPVGTCKVFITKENMPGSGEGEIDTSIEGMDAGQIRAMREGQGLGGPAKKSKPLIPPEYSDPEKTKIEFEVPAGGTEKADFNL